ncbi:MAG: hypothetical protein E7279_09300 [Lachnospiraceae bacterium]|nr:hypothetical protein [Lachnospiraceae bacterium]
MNLQDNFEKELRNLMGDSPAKESNKSSVEETGDIECDVDFQKNFEKEMNELLGFDFSENTEKSEDLESGGVYNNDYIYQSEDGVEDKRITYKTTIKLVSEYTVVTFKETDSTRSCSINLKAKTGKMKTNFFVNSMNVSGSLTIKEKVSLLGDESYKCHVKIITENKKKQECKFEGYESQISIFNWNIGMRKNENGLAIFDKKREIATFREKRNNDDFPKTFLGFKLPYNMQKEYGHIIIINNEQDELKAIFAYAYYLSIKMFEHKELDETYYYDDLY